MEEAKQDSNRVATIQGISTVDGTPTDIYVDPTTGAILTET